MKIGDFISELKTHGGYNFTVSRNDDEGQATVTFDAPYTWSDGNEKISSVCVTYSSLSRRIKSFKIYGENLLQILGYTQIYRIFFGCDIIGFNHFGMDNVPPYIILFTDYED